MKLTCVSAAVTLIWLDEKKLPLEIDKANSFSKCENLIIIIKTQVGIFNPLLSLFVTLLERR